MMNTKNFFKNISLIATLLVAITITGCSNDDDEAPHEHEEEVITHVKLIFTNDANSQDVVEAEAVDPDGEGVEELEVLEEITLDANTTYTLTYEILHMEDDETHNIGEEIEELAEQHQFFFSFTEDAFADPTGDGNIDDASHSINYNDEDDNGYPVGLSTTWTTGSEGVTDGAFTVRLQHQPDIKTATSGAEDGDSDFDLEFVLNIQSIQ